MMLQSHSSNDIDAIDRQLIVATQAGLPLVPRPYDVLAEQVGLSSNEVQHRFRSMLENGIIRRVGVVPNHYRLGYVSNGMSVWNVRDEVVDEMGEIVGALDYVSHCYRRPRHLPLWPYNLFAMVHGRTRDEVEEKVESIAEILSDKSNSHEILYSTRVLKKTGLRLSKKENV